jgi:adsorption protein B
LGEVYWLWRDRKGLIANPLSLASNVVFLYGLATAAWARVPPLASHVIVLTVTLQALRTSVRMACVARIYGAVFALGVPFRAVYANLLNSAATFQAVARYAAARIQGRPLKWLKTEHAFPSRATLLEHKRKLGEILVSSGYLSASALRAALAAPIAGLRLGEQLVRAGQVDEEAVYEALSLQQGLPLSSVDPNEIPLRIAHALPQHAARQWRVLPFRVAEGSLFLAGPDLPTTEMNAALRSFTALQIRFHLVTPKRFEKLTGALL